MQITTMCTMIVPKKGSMNEAMTCGPKLGIKASNVGLGYFQGLARAKRSWYE